MIALLRRLRVELAVLAILLAGLTWSDEPVFEVVLELMGVR